MQAASEMYAKIKDQVASAAQTVESHAASQAVKKQVDQLVSLVQTNLKVSQEEGSSTSATSEHAEVASEELPETVSTPQWALGISKDVLNKVKGVPAYISSTAYSAKCHVLNTVQGGLKSLNTSSDNIALTTGKQEEVSKKEVVAADPATDVAAIPEETAEPSAAMNDKTIATVATERSFLNQQPAASAASQSKPWFPSLRR